MAKSLVCGVGGLALAAAFALAIGYLELQRIAVNAGAVMDWNNRVVGVTDPNPGWLPMAGIAVAATIVAAVLLQSLRSSSRASGVSFAAGFVVGTAALVAVVAVGFAGDFAVTASMSQQEGFKPGVLGWLEYGGMSSVVHVVALLGLVAVWLVPAKPASRASVTPSR